MDLPLDVEEEQAFEMYNQGTTEATPYAQDPNVIALQERMLHMENALGPSDQALGGAGREEYPKGLGQPEDELIAEACQTVQHDVKDLQRLIHKITKEFQEVQKESKPLGQPFLVGEIFCSSESPLTQQIQNLGHQAFRFGLAQGDLSTTSGRQKLFRTIACHRPKHLWYSPVCGPWSSWSALNASKSMEAQWEYQQKRNDLRYQIALGSCCTGIKYPRDFTSVGNNLKDHLCWYTQESMKFINTLRFANLTCVEAGDLKDPVNHNHIKKGMQVVTTHENFVQSSSWFDVPQES